MKCECLVPGKEEEDSQEEAMQACPGKPLRGIQTTLGGKA